MCTVMSRTTIASLFQNRRLGRLGRLGRMTKFLDESAERDPAAELGPGVPVPTRAARWPTPAPPPASRRSRRARVSQRETSDGVGYGAIVPRSVKLLEKPKRVGDGHQVSRFVRCQYELGS